MNEFFAAVVPVLSHTLLHFLWQGTLIGALAMLALQGLRQARPHARYAVACVALLACMVIPVLVAIAQIAANARPASSAMMRTDPSLVSIGSHAFIGQDLLAFPATMHFTDMSSWIVALWAGGTSIMFLRMALGLAWVRQLRRAPTDALQAAWQIRLDALAIRFGLRHRVLLRLVDALDTPMSAGWWRPVVLLPTALLTRMPADLIEALLAHELAHIRRHDYLVNLLQNVAEALLFYHPVTWWLSRRIRVEREHVADRIAADVIRAPRQLAVALLQLSDLQGSGTGLHLAQAASGGDLLSRIQQLVRPAKHVPHRARFVLSSLVLAAAWIGAYSSASIPWSSPAPVSRGSDAPVRTSFALVPKTGDAISMWGPDDDPVAINAARRSVPGEFLWVRRDGLDYVITDASLLARAQQAWLETNTLSEQLDALNAAMAIRYTRAGILRDRVEALSAPIEPSSDELQARSDWDGVIRQQRAESVRQNALEKAWKSLTSESDRAMESMEALSQQIERLTQQRDKAAERTQRELQSLMQNALALGLAKQAPVRA
jgi:beta-lactamase regulating signal transducer with metallopeptidase domain